LADLCAVLVAAGAAEVVLGWLAVRRFSLAAPVPGSRPPVSVLKPLHGEESLLEEALSGFCAQDYPEIQLVFGVQDPADRALAVVARLRERFPDLAKTTVIDDTPHGQNGKISNLVNMVPHARHPVVLVSDSDMHVGPDYVARVIDTLEQPGTGLVTSVYTGRPARACIASALGCAYINQIFLPGVLLARWLGRQDCMGATMALRRETLERIGGFRALASYIADDAVLGHRVVGLGLKVALAPVAPQTTVEERRLADIAAHELRWARTNRGVAPLAFAASILIQFPLFWAGLLCTLMPNEASAWAAFAGMWALRAVCGADIERRLGAPVTPFWLAPVRDTMSVCISLVAYAGRRVAWRGRLLHNTDHRLFAGAPVTLLPGEG
jgi:ceramide glucosyltransferase